MPCPEFDLIEIEGDAAFLARQADTVDGDATVALTLDAAMAMHRAFHVERQYVATNLCPCNSCTQATNLKLKFVAHIGEVATQTIRQRRKLVGIDVILVHRLLKNPVEVPEYLLLSEELYHTANAPTAWSRARGVSGPRGDRPGSGVLRGRGGPPGFTHSPAGSIRARTPPEDLGRRRLRHAVHAGLTPPARCRLRFLRSAVRWRSWRHLSERFRSEASASVGNLRPSRRRNSLRRRHLGQVRERRLRRPGGLAHQGRSGPDQGREHGDAADLDISTGEGTRGGRNRTRAHRDEMPRLSRWRPLRYRQSDPGQGRIGPAQ